MKRILTLGLNLLLSLGWFASAQALQVGDPVPAFEAESTHGKVRLVDLTDRGMVVLAFYYADFTPT